MIKKLLPVVMLVAFLGFTATAWAQNGFGLNAGNGQGVPNNGLALGGDGVCSFGDGTGWGLGLLLGFGDGTEPKPMDGTGFGAPDNR